VSLSALSAVKYRLEVRLITPELERPTRTRRPLFKCDVFVVFAMDAFAAFVFQPIVRSSFGDR